MKYFSAKCIFFKIEEIDIFHTDFYNSCLHALHVVSRHDFNEYKRLTKIFHQPYLFMHDFSDLHTSNYFIFHF